MRRFFSHPILALVVALILAALAAGGLLNDNLRFALVLFGLAVLIGVICAIEWFRDGWRLRLPYEREAAGNIASSPITGDPAAPLRQQLAANLSAVRDFKKGYDAIMESPSTNQALPPVDVASIDWRGLEGVRVRAYQDNHGLFLVHRWRPSTISGQVADITLSLHQHGAGPLTNGTVESVEYVFGGKFDEHATVKTNPHEGFALPISAWGPFHVVARVCFKDALPPLLLQRYVNFEKVSAPTSDVPAASRDYEARVKAEITKLLPSAFRGIQLTEDERGAFERTAFQGCCQRGWTPPEVSVNAVDPQQMGLGWAWRIDASEVRNHDAGALRDLAREHSRIIGLIRDTEPGRLLRENYVPRQSAPPSI